MSALVPTEVSLDPLKGFLDAFNRHDLDAIMACFHGDCVFCMPRGQGPRGDRYVGRMDSFWKFLGA